MLSSRKESSKTETISSLLCYCRATCNDQRHIFIMMFILFISFFLASFSDAFPDSASPVMVVPSLDNPALQPDCVVNILKANCSSYDQISSQLLEIPPDCPEKGTQFDRVGAVWIGDIEVLRTTTPEPTSAGIEWNIEKDLTLYSQYLIDSKQALYTSLSIPNNVDSTYTGIIEVEISLVFYNEINESEHSTVTDVFPLTKAPSSSAFPWDAMTVVGNQSLSYAIQLSSDYSDLFLEVYASGHGCEEFFYSNLPGNYAASMGICGNGVYREIQVFVDGKLAGAVYPFPVIYSGGINPFLWRPVAGTMSFSIPSHRFDISPFLHLFSDGLSHTISMSVYGNNQDDGGFWYLDATLLGYRNIVSRFHSLGSLGSIVVSSELHLYDSGVQEEVVRISDEMLFDNFLRGDQTLSIGFQTTGFHVFNASRITSFSNGTIIRNTVSGKLSLVNNNSYIGSTTGITFQQTLNSISSERVEEHDIDLSDRSERKIINGKRYTTVTADYSPLYVQSFYNENATSMNIEATVNFSYNRIKFWSAKDIQLDSSSDRSFWFNIPSTISTDANKIFVLQWNDALESKAAYNRSLDHSIIYEESDTARERFLISLNDKQGASCYNRATGADDGYFTHDTIISNECNLPDGLRLCEYDICGPLSLTGVQNILATFQSASNTSHDASARARSDIWSHYFAVLFPNECVFSNVKVRQFMQTVVDSLSDAHASDQPMYFASGMAKSKRTHIERAITPSDLAVKIRTARKNP